MTDDLYQTGRARASLDRLARVEQDIADATNYHAARYMSLTLSPQLHRRLLNYAHAEGVIDCIGSAGLVRGQSLEGATIALVLSRFFEGEDAREGTR